MRTLMLVNPPTKESLFRDAKKINRKITKKEFSAALRQYWQQHHALPDSVSKVDVPGVSEKIKVLVTIGNVKEIRYKPTTKSSRKYPHIYKHRTDEILVTDASGKYQGFVGNMCTRDGWQYY